MNKNRETKFAPVLLTLTPDMVRELDEIADRNGLKNRSALVRQALTGFIKQEQKEQRKTAA